MCRNYCADGCDRQKKVEEEGRKDERGQVTDKHSAIIEIASVSLLRRHSAGPGRVDVDGKT